MTNKDYNFAPKDEKEAALDQIHRQIEYYGKQMAIFEEKMAHLQVNFDNAKEMLGKWKAAYDKMAGTPPEGLKED